MMLGIVAFVGEHGPDPRHDGEGGQEQPLEHQSVVDVGCGGRTGDGHAVAGDVVLGAPLAPVSWVGPGQVPSRRNWRKVATTRTVADRGWPRPRSFAGVQKSMTVAIRSKSLTRRAAKQNPITFSHV